MMITNKNEHRCCACQFVNKVYKLASKWQSIGCKNDCQEFHMSHWDLRDESIAHTSPWKRVLHALKKNMREAKWQASSNAFSLK